MADNDLVTIAVIASLLFGVGLVLLGQRLWTVGDGEPHVRFWGAYSPILTWLKYRRLPPARFALAVRRPPVAAPGTQPAHAARPVAESVIFSALLALVLAVMAQFLLLDNPNRPGLALSLYAAAVVLFIGCHWRLGLASAEVVFPAVHAHRQPPAVALFVTSAVLSVYAVERVSGALTSAEGYLLAGVWLLSIAVYAWSVFRLTQWRPLALAKLRAASRAHRGEALLIVLLLALALAVRIYDLELHPYAFVNDEGEVGKNALAILRGQVANLFATGWSGQPNWSFTPTALAVSLLGNTAFAARLVSAVQGALAVAFVYLLGREAFDRRTAVMAALVLIGLSWHVHFSRLAVNNVVDSFFAAGVFWLLYRALSRGGLLDYLWAGLASGLTVYSYLGSRLVLVLAVSLLVFAWLRRRLRLGSHLRHLLVYAGAVAVVAAPMLAYYFQHVDVFMSRMSAEGILLNGWLQRQVAATGQGAAALLLDQFKKSTFVFITGIAPGQFYNAPRPYLPALAAVFLVLSLGYALWRSAQPRYFLLTAWFWSVVIFGSTLTLGPPSHQRLTMAAPAVALLVAVGLRETFRLLERLQWVPARLALALGVLVAGVASAQGVAFYFGEYRAGHYFEDPSNEFSYEVAQVVRALGPDYRVYLLGAPSVYALFGDFHYLAPEIAYFAYQLPLEAWVAR
jgi:4-amino-4-deoxy-L-arabinose transferase-like glycosyltransferase